MNEEDDAYCELSFSPNVSLISTVRRFAADFYVKVLENASVTSRLVVATHELLENAVRYSSDGRSTVRIGVKRHGDQSISVRIDTQNRGDPKAYGALKSLVSELAASNGSAAARDAAYQKLMAKSAKRDAGSGLGLGRIHAEAEMDLSCSIDDKDIVHMIAEGVFTCEGGKGMSGIANIETAELTTETEFGSSNVTVRMVGSAETNAMKEVDEFLKRLHERVISGKLREVIVDMRSLEFMNSSCFKAFVSWIDRLQDTPPDDRYCVRFIHDERKHWQSRSLGALAGFAVDLIRVESS